MYEIVKVKKSIETTKIPFDYVQGHVSLTSLTPFLIFFCTVHSGPSFPLSPLKLIPTSPLIPPHATFLSLSRKKKTGQ